MSRMKQQSTSGFLTRNKKYLVSLALTCVGLDIFAMLALFLWIPGVEFATGLFFFVAQMAIGIFYIKFTAKFVSGSVKSLSATANVSKSNKQFLKAMHRMARFLFYSAMATIVLCIGMAIISFSGEFFYGIWTPTGWTLTWIIIIISRYLISFSQIQMCKPKASKKGKGNRNNTITTGMDNSTGTDGDDDDAQSTVNSTVDSTFDYGDDDGVNSSLGNSSLGANSSLRTNGSNFSSGDRTNGGGTNGTKRTAGDTNTSSSFAN